MVRVTKAIIPAAGLGSRVRSVAHGLPKEMLPVGSKTLIQHALEMHISSGVKDIAIILHPEKEIIRNFLEGSIASPAFLEIPPRDQHFREVLKDISLRFMYQNERRGVVDAVLLARDFVKDEPFALIMPDCLLLAEKPFLAQIMEWAPQGAAGIIGFIMLEKDRADTFGNVGLLSVSPLRGPLYSVSRLSDKGPEAIHFDGSYQPKGFGGGIYSCEYFEYVAASIQSDGPEWDDVPIHQEMAANGRLYGVKLEGMAFDLGNPKGYLEACRFLQDRSRAESTQ
jgi:UTP--glucose-1-phosphate uridylyltransferase